MRRHSWLPLRRISLRSPWRSEPRDRLGRRREIVHELACQLALAARDPRLSLAPLSWSTSWQVTSRELQAAERLARALLRQLDWIHQLAAAGETAAASSAMARMAARLCGW